MEIGDAFFDGKFFIFVIKKHNYELKGCDIFCAETGIMFGYSVESIDTLKNMRKLSQLEKELM
jgi:hypothetical protein